MDRGPVAPLTGAPTGKLSTAVAALCDDTSRALRDEPLRRSLTEIRAKLSEPLRVAIAGTVSSGKSTLVNALLGRAIAPVDASDCTKVVTWFRFGVPERVECVAADGSVETRPLPLGRPLADVVGEAAGIASLVVWLSNERLREVTLIDTPGLDSIDPARERTTRTLLALDAGSRAAVAAADALIVMMPLARRADGALLERFAAVTAGAGLSAVNAVGVISKADRLAEAGQDPWPAAHRVAQQAAADLPLSVSQVVPVIGLIAATALTGVMTEADAHALSTLAAGDPQTLDGALVAYSEWLALDSPLPLAVRRALLSRLDLYGLRVALAAAPRGALAVTTALREASGFAALDAIITDTFARRSDALKTHMAAAALDRLSYQAAEPADAHTLRELRNALDGLVSEPGLHELRLLNAVRSAAEGQLDLPRPLRADIERIARHESAQERLALPPTADRAALKDAAATASARWALWGNDPRRSARERAVARDLRTAYEWIWHGA